MKTITYLFFCFFIGSMIANAQTKFHQVYNYTSSDIGNCIQQTSDNGFIFVGSSILSSREAIRITKTDVDGVEIWTKVHGGTGVEIGYSIEQTTDGGYIIAGKTESFGSGIEDPYLVKISTTGIVEWANNYGTATNGVAYSVQQTDDGGFIFTGHKFTSSYDILLVKTNFNGDTLWTKTYGGAQEDYGRDVRQTQDGGYIIVGHTKSYGGSGSFDIYLIKTDSLGGVVWTKTYGGSSEELGYSARQTANGGYIIVGTTRSYGLGIEDVYLIKTKSNGDTLWTQTFGGTKSDIAHSVQNTIDGGYIIGGYSNSFGTDAEDFYAIKTNSSGDLVWQKNYGFSNNYSEQAYFVQQTKDTGFVFIGKADDDIYLLKTLSNGCAIRIPKIIVNTHSIQANFICEGESVILEVNRDYYSYLWSTGESTKNIDIGDNPGNYSITVQDQFGCTESSSILNLSQLAMPVVNVNPNGPTIYCPGDLDSVTLIAFPGGYPGYLWNTGSTDINSSLVVKQTGDYTVTVTDINGCQNTSDTVSIEYFQPFEDEVICLVTVDTILNKNVIIWERTSGKRTDFYNIYKEDYLSNYEKIGSTSYEKLSVFVDKYSDPKKKSDRYKITSVDKCGTESGKSDFHKTLHLTANTGTGVEINLIWENYEGIPNFFFRLYRGSSPGNLTKIDSFQSGIFTYSDYSPPQGLVFYQISMVTPDTCSPLTIRGMTSSGPYSQSLSNLKDYSLSNNDYLTLSPNFQGLYSDGDTTSLSVYTSLSIWSASSSESWVTLTPNISDGIIKVVAEENFSSSSREVIVTVEGQDVDPQQAILVQGAAGTNIKEIILNNELSVYPNPYTDFVNISYSLRSSSNVRLEVYNIVGKKICSLVDEKQNTGKHQYSFNAKSYGYSVGLYFLKLQINEKTSIRKLIELQ